MSAANVSQFACARKHHERQCFRNSVSSFASTLRKRKLIPFLRPKHSFKVLANEDTFCCGYIVADTNVSPFARARNMCVSGTQKMFLILFRNILCPQQMFPSLHSPRNIMSNNVSRTMCPRLPVPLGGRFPRSFYTPVLDNTSSNQRLRVRSTPYSNFNTDTLNDFPI